MVGNTEAQSKDGSFQSCVHKYAIICFLDVRMVSFRLIGLPIGFLSYSKHLTSGDVGSFRFSIEPFDCNPGGIGFRNAR